MYTYPPLKAQNSFCPLIAVMHIQQGMSPHRCFSHLILICWKSDGIVEKWAPVQEPMEPKDFCGIPRALSSQVSDLGLPDTTLWNLCFVAMRKSEYLLNIFLDTQCSFLKKS